MVIGPLPPPSDRTIRSNLCCVHKHDEAITYNCRENNLGEGGLAQGLPDPRGPSPYVAGSAGAVVTPLIGGGGRGDSSVWLSGNALVSIEVVTVRKSNFH